MRTRVFVDALRLAVLFLVAMLVFDAAASEVWLVVLVGAPAIGLLAAGRHWRALPLVGAAAWAAVRWHVSTAPAWATRPDVVFSWRPVVAVTAVVGVLAVVGSTRRPDVRVLAWALVPAALFVFGGWGEGFGLGEPFSNVQGWLFVAAYLGVLGYAVVDPRPALAAAFVLLLVCGYGFAYQAAVLIDPFDAVDHNLLYALLIPGVPVAAAWIRLHRGFHI
jgi:hypothetical protein